MIGRTSSVLDLNFIEAGLAPSRARLLQTTRGVVLARRATRVESKTHARIESHLPIDIR